MKIGHVDLDTSHPANWVPLERELGHEVVGIWDGGSVHPPEYVNQFALDHQITKIFSRLDEMAQEIDCAMIHSCNWDTHVARARPFIEAGKSVLIDKPLAGNLRDLLQLLKWADQGARIAGGSALWFCQEIREWQALPISERGTPRTAFCGCAVDEFNYGIHAYAMLSHIMGAGVQRVRHLGGAGQRHLQAEWDDGRTGLLAIGSLKEWIPFYATIVTEKSATHLEMDANQLYRSILEATLPYLSGATETVPVAFGQWMEPEWAALAARRSRLEGDSWVNLADLQESDEGYDGNLFAAEYQKEKYPNTPSRL